MMLQSRTAGGMSKSAIASVSLAAAFLAGCQTIYEGKYDYAQGWRRATVANLQISDEVTRRAYTDCRDRVDPQARTSSGFIVVSFPEKQPHPRLAGTLTRRVIVPVPPESGFKAGDPVYLNLRDCSAPLVVRNDKR